MNRNQRREAHERKRAGGFASPRLVKVLGADARLAQNDEPDAGAFTEEQLQAADLERDAGKAERMALRDFNRAVRLEGGSERIEVKP